MWTGTGLDDLWDDTAEEETGTADDEDWAPLLEDLDETRDDEVLNVETVDVSVTFAVDFTTDVELSCE